MDKRKHISPKPQLGIYEFFKFFCGLVLSYSVKHALGNNNWLKFRSSWDRIKYTGFNPLENSFGSILIQTTTGCNLNCPFCPANKPRNRNYGGANSGMKMEWNVYKKIIDDLADLDYSGIVRPCLMNEPLLDDRLTKLIGYTDARLPNAWIQIESNGELVTEELVKEMFEAGLDEAIFNDYPTNRKLEKDFAQWSIGIETYFVQPLYVPWKQQKRKEKRIFVISRCYDENLSNRAGNVPQYKPPLKEPLKLMCDQPFLYMYIGYNGKAVLCCNDWGFEEILGDAKIDSVRNIWTGRKYREIREHLLRGERKGLCSRCDNTPRGPGKGMPSGLSSLVPALRNVLLRHA